MKRIGYLIPDILSIQLASIASDILSGKVLIASMIVDNDNLQAIEENLKNTVIKYRVYELDNAYKLLLISKKESYFDFTEEINRSNISIDLKQYFIQSVFNTKI